MNILFVSFSSGEGYIYGGTKGSFRNFKSLEKNGRIFKYIIKKRSNFKSLISILERNMPPLLNKDIQNIREIIKTNKIDICFLDSSLFGEIIEKLSIPCITFFHNCEWDYLDVIFGEKRTLKKIVYRQIVKKVESNAVIKSNRTIALSVRDSRRLEKLYGKPADYIIPLSIADTYEEDVQTRTNRLKKDRYKSVLLFGPVGPANDEAFSWFIKYVSPHLSCMTILAGKGMEHFKDKENDKVKVIGYVENLSSIYEEVDCVAIPLLSGAGMKIKTAEALMYGKMIFGTKEAFEGFEEQLDTSFSKECDSADEFIYAINNFMASVHAIYYPEARETYLNFFSVEATQNKFDKVVKNLCGYRKY